MQTQIKNRTHGVLAKQGLKSPLTDLFGIKGRAWLSDVELRSIYRLEIDSYLRMLEAIRNELKKVDQEISQRAKHDTDTQLLVTLPGIGPLTALLIKAEVGTFERFHSPDKLASYAGLVSSSRSSGGTVRLGKITKQGSKYLRWALVQAAARVNPKWGRLWVFYRKIQFKKGNKIARVALARKLLVIALVSGQKRRVLPHSPSWEFWRREAVTLVKSLALLQGTKP